MIPNSSDSRHGLSLPAHAEANEPQPDTGIAITYQQETGKDEAETLAAAQHATARYEASGAVQRRNFYRRAHSCSVGPALNPAEQQPKLSLSWSELACLEVIAEDTAVSPASSCRVLTEPDEAQLDALSYRLSLYLNDPEVPVPSRRPARSRRHLSRRSSELLYRPAAPAAVKRRHSELASGPGGGRRSRRSSRRLSTRSSRSASHCGSVRLRRSEISLYQPGAAAGSLLPTAQMEPKERRRRQVALAVMAGAFIIISMSVGLIFVMLYLTSSQGDADSDSVRKENEEMYRSRQNVINVSSTVASALDGDG